MTITELAEKSASIQYTYKVTPDVYYCFQRCSNDYNPLHTDEYFAKDKGFSNRVMYGNILNAFISHFVGMLLPTREVMILAQDIKFISPIFLNDELTFKANVDGASELANAIRYKFTFDRNGEIVAKGRVQIGLLKKAES